MSIRPNSAVNMPMVFSENDTFFLAELLVTVAKEEPITAKQREFAAMLLVRMDRVIKSKAHPNANSLPVRPDLRSAPIFNPKRKKGGQR